MQALSRTKEVLVQLDLQKKKQEGKLIAIIEHKNSHGNFILSTIIDHGLKNNSGICFVSVFNPISHYQHVSSKLGYNLKAAIDKTQVEFIDVLSMTRDMLLQDNATMHLGKSLVQLLIEKMKEILSRLFNHHGLCYIFVDDLSALLSLGVDFKIIQGFVHYLQVLATHGINESTKNRCCVVVLSHMEDEDIESSRLGAALVHAAVSHVNVTENRCMVVNIP